MYVYPLLYTILQNKLIEFNMQDMIRRYKANEYAEYVAHSCLAALSSRPPWISACAENPLLNYESRM